MAYSFKVWFRGEIGQKFWGEVGSFPGFGKVTIRAFNISVGKDVEEAAALKNLEMGSNSKGLKCLKYSPVNPSGPGDLLFGKESMAVLIFVHIKGVLRF